jgi:hypothetical protein
MAKLRLRQRIERGRRPDPMREKRLNGPASVHQPRIVNPDTAKIGISHAAGWPLPIQPPGTEFLDPETEGWKLAQETANVH